MAKIYAIANAKGGVGKTTTAINFGAALSLAGQRVLLIDNDPQRANMTLALGYESQDLRYTVSNLLCAILDDPEELPECVKKAILSRNDFDLIPANKRLSGIATRLVIEQNSLVQSHDFVHPALVMRALVQAVKDDYDSIIIDCGPRLDMLMTAALAATDQVIIPVQVHYLAAEGISDILETIQFVREHYNPSLQVGGILLTMYQARTNSCRDIQGLVYELYGPGYHVFQEPIGLSIKVAEPPAFGESLLSLNPKHSAALAYRAMAAEVLASA